jgi:hypothetical protein
LLLFALSVWQKDSMALASIVCLSFLSSLIGWSNKWKLNLQLRKRKNVFEPPGDVAIRYPKGNFLIVQCSEDVSRELYFAPENIDYMIKEAWQYRIVSLFATVLLIFGIIFLSNASVPLQIGFASAYILMNAFYWIVAALPSRLHWDMSCFEVKEQCFSEDGEIPEPYHNKYLDKNETFTWALWKAILATKEIDWIRRSQTAPSTPAWDEWLHEALTRAKNAGTSDGKTHDGKDIKVWNVPAWDPQEALAQCMGRTEKEGV